MDIRWKTSPVWTRPYLRTPQQKGLFPLQRCHQCDIVRFPCHVSLWNFFAQTVTLSRKGGEKASLFRKFEAALLAFCDNHPVFPPFRSQIALLSLILLQVACMPMPFRHQRAPFPPHLHTVDHVATICVYRYFHVNVASIVSLELNVKGRCASYSTVGSNNKRAETYFTHLSLYPFLGYLSSGYVGCVRERYCIVRTGEDKRTRKGLSTILSTLLYLRTASACCPNQKKMWRQRRDVITGSDGPPLYVALRLTTAGTLEPISFFFLSPQHVFFPLSGRIPFQRIEGSSFVWYCGCFVSPVLPSLSRPPSSSSSFWLVATELALPVNCPIFKKMERKHLFLLKKGFLPRKWTEHKKQVGCSFLSFAILKKRPFCGLDEWPRGRERKGLLSNRLLNREQCSLFSYFFLTVLFVAILELPDI